MIKMLNERRKKYRDKVKKALNLNSAEDKR